MSSSFWGERKGWRAMVFGFGWEAEDGRLYLLKANLGVGFGLFGSFESVMTLLRGSVL